MTARRPSKQGRILGKSSDEKNVGYMCCVVLRCVALRCACGVLCCAVLCCVVLCCVVLCCVVLCCACVVLCCISAFQYFTTLTFTSIKPHSLFYF